ncbi:MAG: thioredoxin [Hyphomicrobiales bacterium]
METIIGGSGATPAGKGEAVVDTTTATFMADVIDASKDRPVLVDFWAEWCGPCRQLAPMLEKVVAASKGKVKLVKMNIDHYPEIAGQLGIRSIPAVVAFKGGQPVDAFMGAVPESKITAFIEKLAGPMGPSVADQLLEAAEAAMEAGDFGSAAEAFAAMLAEDGTDVRAIAGLARCYIETGDLDHAEQTLAMVPINKQNDPAVASAKAKLELARNAGNFGDALELEARLESNPDDHQARFDLALLLAGHGKREAAVDALIEIVRRDRTWNDDGARKQLVTFFDAWGAKDPLTAAGRRKLSSVLFR